MRGGWAARGTVAIRLGRPHFAFYRGYLDGLDIATLAKRYLVSVEMHDDSQLRSADLRLARSMLGWIRAQLQRTARRNGRSADARILGIVPGALRNDMEGAQPTLAQFQEEHDPDGLFSEEELIALFSETWPDNGKPGRHAMRNQRLRVRQHHALTQLEQHIGIDPSAVDMVDMWIDPGLAAHLSAAGVLTIVELLNFIDRYGYRWYRQVPGIGLKAALLIAIWLQEDTTRAALGRGITADALLAPRALRSADARPAEGQPLAKPDQSFFTEASSPMCQVSAEKSGTGLSAPRLDDLAMVEAWLAMRPLSGHTARAYRRESKRFLTWVATECGAALGTMTASDVSRYGRFLGMLGVSTAAEWARMFSQNQEKWIGERIPAHCTRCKRLFRGALTPASQHQALLIIRNLLTFLQSKRSPSDENLGAMLEAPSKIAAHRKPRILTMDDFSLLLNNFCEPRQSHVDLMAWRITNPISEDAGHTSLAELRLRCILLLMGEGGLRVSELSQLCRHQIFLKSGLDVKAGFIELRMASSRIRARTIVLQSASAAALVDYIAARGLFLDTMPASLPVIAILGGKAAVSSQRLYALVKRALSDAARQIELSAPTAAVRLLQASPDWLRKMREAQFGSQG